MSPELQEAKKALAEFEDEVLKMPGGRLALDIFKDKADAIIRSKYRSPMGSVFLPYLAVYLSVKLLEEDENAPQQS